MIIVRRVARSRSTASFAAQIDEIFASASRGIHDDLANIDTSRFIRKPGWVVDHSKPDIIISRTSNRSLAGAIPGLVLAAGAVGAGAYFLRRRRSKNGKMIVEQVRR